VLPCTSYVSRRFDHLRRGRCLFSSFRTKDGTGPILNCEQGRSVTGWGRLIFYVADMDAIWAYLRERISSGEAAGRFMGQAIFPYARSGWA